MIIMLSHVCVSCFVDGNFSELIINKRSFSLLISVLLLITSL